MRSDKLPRGTYDGQNFSPRMPPGPEDDSIRRIMVANADVGAVCHVDTEENIDRAMDLAELIVQREADALVNAAVALRNNVTTRNSMRRAIALALRSTSAVPNVPGGKLIVSGIGKSGMSNEL